MSEKSKIEVDESQNTAVEIIPVQIDENELLSEIEEIDVNLLDDPDERQEQQIIENRKVKSSSKPTYKPIFDRNGQRIKGIREKYIDERLIGYDAMFCYGYETKYSEKDKCMKKVQVNEHRVFTSKREALKWYKELELLKMDMKEKGQQIKKSGYTLEQVCDLYYEDRRAAKVGKGYLQQIRGQKENHFMTFFIGDKQYVKKISTQDVIDYLRYEEGRGYSKSSIVKYKSHLKQLWDYMLQNKAKFQISENVVVPAPVEAKSSDFESIALNYQQFLDYLNEAMNAEEVTYLFLFVFAYTMSFRRGEMAGLMWGDIDWENKRITIKHNRVQRTKKDMESDDYDDADKKGVKLPKMNKIREVELHDVSYDTLLIYKEWQEEILKRKVKDDEFVLQFELNLVNGYDPNVSKISVRWREFRDRVNKRRKKERLEPLVRCRLHDGRETSVTMMLDGVKKPDGTYIAAVNRYQVYSHAGHSYTNSEKNTTEKVYHKPTDERWDVTRFWNELIEYDIRGGYEFAKMIREQEYAAMREEKRELLKEQKRKRYAKAKEERLKAKEQEEDIVIEYTLEGDE